MSLGIRGGEVVAFKRRRVVGTELIQQNLDSVETLTTGSTFQRVSKFDTIIQWALLANNSVRPITLRLLTDGVGGTIGQGAVLAQADANGQGGGVMVLPRPNLFRWFWTTSTTGDKMYVLKLN